MNLTMTGPHHSTWIRIGRMMHRSPTKAREAVWGILFTMPWLLGLLLFTAGPILASLYLSLLST